MTRMRTLALAAVLLGAAGGLGLALTSGCDSAPEDLDGSPVRVEKGTISGAGIRDADWAIARPEGDEEVPLVLALHGQGGQAGDIIGRGLRVEDVLADLLDGGAAPFAIAAVTGGDTYWHPRDDGTDSGRLVTEHLVGRVKEHAVDTSRLGLIGWSMGGYGALRIAGDLGRERVAGVSAVSPALWHSWRDVPDVAFDDAADYEEYGVAGRQRELRGIPVRLDCGESDVFFGATKRYAQGLGPRVETHYGPGDHSLEYWATGVRSQLEWLGGHLTG